MKYLYLHGLGQKPDSWNRVIKETKVSKSSCSLSLSEMLEGKSMRTCMECNYEPQVCRIKKIGTDKGE